MMTELEEQECWELVATQQVGRVAWVTDQGPVVVPVNFAVDDGHVLLQTAAFSHLVHEADDGRVAFEVDEVDPILRSGWSVLLRGRAEVVYLDWRHPEAGAVEPWADPTRHTTVRIAVDQVTGRRVVAP